MVPHFVSTQPTCNPVGSVQRKTCRIDERNPTCRFCRSFDTWLESKVRTFSSSQRLESSSARSEAAESSAGRKPLRVTDATQCSNQMIIHRNNLSGDAFHLREDGRPLVVTRLDHDAFVPMRAGVKFGLISAPRVPHAVQTNRGCRSDSLTSSGHGSALIAMWCEHL